MSHGTGLREALDGAQLAPSRRGLVSSLAIDTRTTFARLASSAWGVPSFAGNVLRAFSASGALFAGSCGTVFFEQHNCNLGWVRSAKSGYRHDSSSARLAASLRR
jgi:hypothetical protein